MQVQLPLVRLPVPRIHLPNHARLCLPAAPPAPTEFRPPYPCTYYSGGIKKLCAGSKGRLEYHGDYVCLPGSQMAGHSEPGHVQGLNQELAALSAKGTSHFTLAEGKERGRGRGNGGDKGQGRGRGKGSTGKGKGGKKGQSKVAPCRHYYSPKGCKAGAACNYAHDGPGGKFTKEGSWW